MAAEDKVKQLSFFRMEGLASTPLRSGIEAAGQTWKAGAPLISSSGKLAEAADDVVTGIVGFATTDASGVTDTPVDYVPAVEGIAFEATLEDQSGGDYALTQANLYLSYALRATAGGLWYLDQNDTPNAAATVIQLVDPIGTVQGRVIARLKNAVTIHV